MDTSQELVCDDVIELQDIVSASAPQRLDIR